MEGNLILRLDSIMFGPVTSPIGCHFTETCAASFQIPSSLWSEATRGRVEFRKTCWVQSCQAGGEIDVWSAYKKRNKANEQKLNHLCLTTPNQMLGLLEGREKYGLSSGRITQNDLAGKVPAVSYSLFWFQDGHNRTDRSALRKTSSTWPQRWFHVGRRHVGRQTKHTLRHHKWKSPGGAVYKLPSSLRYGCTPILCLQVCVYAATGDQSVLLRRFCCHGTAPIFQFSPPNWQQRNRVVWVGFKATMLTQ